ncbi:MAG: hypothetical protein QOI81_1054 [Actinomycetota bacterium]|nr:hypothetical protein [Actinomycetota bacterium]
MSEPKNRESLLLPILVPFGALAVIALALFGFSRILLSISHHAATAVALGAAIGIMAIASFVATRKKVSSGALAGVAFGVVGFSMLIGGIAIVAIGPEKVQAQPAKPQLLALTAPAGAASNGFKPTTLSAEPDKPIQIVLDNQDPGIQHNVAVFASDPAKDPSAKLFGTKDPVTGPAKLTVDVAALPAGTYYFQCDVHPATMHGELTVAKGAGGSAGATISATKLQFSSKEIDLPASQPSTITFTNNDAGTDHNIAIYSDKAYTNNLFTGTPVRGPATKTYDVLALDPGTYYFRCEFHPTTMTGTVVVGGTGGGGSGNGGGGGGETPPPTTPPPTGSPPSSSGGGGAATAEISAQGSQFSTNALTLHAGGPTSLKFTNNDAGIAHNVAIFSDSGYSTGVFTGAFVTGPGTATYDVPALEPGTYYFRCDAHPTTMTGTITVK